MPSNEELMSLCATCPEPGLCCRDFYWNPPTKHSGWFNPKTWKRDISRMLNRVNLPFIARVAFTDKKSGRVRLKFDCPNLQPDGRCRDYANRPLLCREFVPTTDILCALHPDKKPAK